MTKIRAWAAMSAGQRLERFDYEPGPLGGEEVEVAVDYCGLCHSDLSMIGNDWGFAAFPLVPGHEVVGRVVALGERTKGLALGQTVGIGWTATSCMHCAPCLGGNQHLCAQAHGVIVNRHGGFADRVRAHWAWTIPLPAAVKPETAGPLFCGGITVFAPLMEYGILPTSRVGVVGIGGLGHMALRFARAWGCEVTAFTSSASKYDEARALGAHRVVSSRDSKAMAAMAGSLDLVIVTANVPLDWDAILATLGPKGRLHFVGAVLEPIPVKAFALIGGQKSVSGSPTGSPVAIARMLEFAARHGIEPQVERFPMSRVNDALDHLRAGKARYRIVLDGDFPS
jgi:uncharacterized zinc-type alcohol dehydrogenase-like protein